MIKSFTDLLAWQENHQLVLIIYRLTKNFPQEEIYSLTDQMRRASISITSNIAEGFGRQTMKDKLNFYYLAQGSLTELKNQLLICRDIGYLSKDDFNLAATQANSCHRLLQGLIQKTKSLIHKS
jgi:four helix bundle protein